MSSMSSFVAKGNSTNIASGSGLTRSLSMTPEQLQRSLRLRTAPGAPRKPQGYDQMPPNMQRMFPEYRSVGEDINTLSPSTLTRGNTVDTMTTGTMLRRTFSAMPGQGAGSFLPPPNGSIQGLLRTGDSTERSVDEKIQQVEKELKEQFKNHPKKRRRWGRARSPTLANVNEVFSPRTDVAVQTLSVMHACDSEGNVNNAQLNQRTLDEGLHKAAKAQSLEELRNLEKSMSGFRYSTQETRDFNRALDALRDTVQEQSRNWEQASFDYDEQVTLNHEGKSISEITGNLPCCGLDVMALCKDPEFTVERVVPLPASPYTNGIPRMYHMHWNKAPSVKLIVSEATACFMFLHNREDAEGAVEVQTEHPCQCGTMIPLTAQLCGKTRCLNENEEEESEEESEDEAVEPLNRSFLTEPLPFPEVGATYVRKERVGSPYEWIGCGLPNAQIEFMQPGHRVVVRKIWSPGYRAVLFESLGGILSNDMAKSTDTFLYKAELSDFHRHMKLVSEEELSKEKPSVEQTSGGSMSEQQSRSRLASLDALQRAQANAKDSNDIPINDKKRKAVENPEEDMAEEVEEASTPTKKRKVGRPKGSTKKKSDVPFAGVVSNQTEYFKMHDERQQQEAILTSIQRANGVKRGAATTKRKFTTRDGTSNRHAVVGEINDQGVLSPVNSPSNLSRSLSWDNGDSLAEL